MYRYGVIKRLHNKFTSKQKRWRKINEDKRRVRRWQKKKTKEQKYLILAGNDSKLIRSQQKKAEDHANLHLKAGFCLILFLLLSPRFMLLLPVSFSFSWPLHGFLAHQHHFAHQPTSLQQHPPTRVDEERACVPPRGWREKGSWERVCVFREWLLCGNAGYPNSWIGEISCFWSVWRAPEWSVALCLCVSCRSHSSILPHSTAFVGYKKPKA